MVRIDIDMPHDCTSCWVRKNLGCKIANASGWLNNRRDEDCTLEEMPTENTVPREWWSKMRAYLNGVSENMRYYDYAVFLLKLMDTCESDWRPSDGQADFL